jgi:transcriptional regulator with XRE-family HTH domain
MQHRKDLADPKRPRLERRAKTKLETSAHSADRHVGRQIAAVRVQSNVSQAELARSIGISCQQLQKYESAENRVSASMLYEIARSLGFPVSRFFEGLPGNESSREAPPLPVDERIDFIASAEGRRLIEGLTKLHPRVRARISALIAALGEELVSLESDNDGEAARKTCTGPTPGSLRPDWPRETHRTSE